MSGHALVCRYLALPFYLQVAVAERLGVDHRQHPTDYAFDRAVVSRGADALAAALDAVSPEPDTDPQSTALARRPDQECR